jgi:site-specific DNA recombinase
MRQLEKSWQTVPKPENEWGKVECDSIISEAKWNQVNEIIQEHTKSWKRPGPSPVHLFGSLAHCGCGAKMYVRAGSPKYVCRKCCNKIPIVDLEAFFQREMRAFFAQPERVAQHLQAASRNLVEKSTLLETHKREIQKTREKMHQTHQLYLNKQISGDGFHELYAPAEERMKQLQAELPKLEAEVDLLRINKLSADDVLNEANSMYDKWPTMPLETKRKIAENLVEKIVIGETDFHINFSYTPSSGELCKNQQGLRSG